METYARGTGEALRSLSGEMRTVTDSSADSTGQQVVAHGHELVSNLDDGLLYCVRCPLVAYDLDDVATEPECPMPLGN